MLDLTETWLSVLTCILLLFFLLVLRRLPSSFFFFFNDTATTEIYTLSLHDALPIYHQEGINDDRAKDLFRQGKPHDEQDRKSTRLNSSHSQISYAVFCLKKKKNNKLQQHADN